ncbi:hypothetical protein [Pseudanabaena sp. FACHB-2040]|uniref:hypothetical protein n=1 Tax=Pseudanabaena sp. FACHB-2040 TaxID=2692859 RepID=UPI0016856145|nr:hypothetical protein [Pseudanabaena sp. FACHB-2040]MBD2257392.1 hypothetical protein [Pseudanabaena sp. FACHB-2040]
MLDQQSSSPSEPSIEDMIISLANSGKQRNRMILIGAPKWVEKIIYLLHAARITEVRDWSQQVPTHHPNEVISLMQRPKVEK